MVRKMITGVACVLFALAASAQTRSADASKEFPVQPGGSLEIEGEFQDIYVTVKPGLTQMKIKIHMEATEWDAKEQLKRYLPDFVQIGSRCFVFVNNVKYRTDLTQIAEIKSVPAYVMQNTVGKPLGKVQVEVPPGVSITAVTAQGRCYLKGDLGEAKLRFDTYSGLIKVEGAADNVDAKTAYADVKIDLSRRVRTLQVAIEKGTVQIGGAADAMEVISKTAPTTIEAPLGVSFTGLLDAQGGRISCDLPGEKTGEGKQFALKGPEGSPTLKVQAENANITVRTDATRVEH